jgi:hypothetical protein
VREPQTQHEPQVREGQPQVRRGLDALLRDLGSQVTAGGAPSLPDERLSSGLPGLDALLGGGFPLGRVSEIAGPASCGRTSLLLALLARVTGRGEFAAIIDAADALDPRSAEAAGVDLDRVLWARPPGVDEALRCTEPVLRAGGFALIALDLTHPTRQPRVPASAWPRLRKSTAGAGAALVVLARDRVAGTYADLAVEMGTAHPQFGEGPDEGPDWLEGIDGRVLVVRNRQGPGDRHAPVRFHTSLRAA